MPPHTTPLSQEAKKREKAQRTVHHRTSAFFTASKFDPGTAQQLASSAQSSSEELTISYTFSGQPLLGQDALQLRTHEALASLVELAERRERAAAGHARCHLPIHLVHLRMYWSAVREAAVALRLAVSQALLARYNSPCCSHMTAEGRACWVQSTFVLLIHQPG